jgi:predicted HAD superfamily phosphohydrolase YqeG
MPLFCPCYRFHRVENITPEFLTAHGIKGILLDVDNTLTTHDNPVPYDGVMEWLESLKKAGETVLQIAVGAGKLNKK